MIDVVLLLVVVAFFALCVGYVRVCDRIIGPDPALPAEEDGLADAGASQAVDA